VNRSRNDSTVVRDKVAVAESCVYAVSARRVVAKGDGAVMKVGGEEARPLHGPRLDEAERPSRANRLR
jgi:hypothetical protein